MSIRFFFLQCSPAVFYSYFFVLLSFVLAGATDVRGQGKTAGWISTSRDELLILRSYRQSNVHRFALYIAHSQCYKWLQGFFSPVFQPCFCFSTRVEKLKIIFWLKGLFRYPPAYTTMILYLKNTLFAHNSNNRTYSSYKRI